MYFMTIAAGFDNVRVRIDEYQAEADGISLN